jgi:ECF sigma factor
MRNFANWPRSDWPRRSRIKRFRPRPWSTKPVRLVAAEKPGANQAWDSRRHFFAAAAEAMHRILLDRARDKRRQKRGGGWRRLRLDHIDLPVREPPEHIVALDESGRPFFAMELVPSVPITDYCDKNNLATRERLDLVLTASRSSRRGR